ncbi:MAG: methylenetetrahydrofolate reductase C-terminal domain-containing protein [Sedimentisphaerales bacterium]|nr:methylenetetrahydrofolate reductase C-terminal domain-containing protein [Sedimentisphaerales bacterium]
MGQKRLRELLGAGDKFVVTAEFVPLPGHNIVNFEKFLAGYAEKRDQIPAGMELAGVTIPQSPGGVASMSPVDIYSVLQQKGLWGDLDVIPHVTAKDHNLDAIETYLVGMRKLGLESVLALTGDKPATSQGVFEVDSIGLIEFIKEMNYAAFGKAKAGEFDKVHQFYVAAAVSQFKYTEASQMQQYYKMAKKLKVGADCLMTQLGWDWRKSEELARYMAEEGLDVPVLGNVYFLTTMTPAPRLMYEGKLPGCVVTKELFEKLQTESPAEHLERAAQQVAMYKDLGYAGVDVGGIFDFDMLVEILQKADAIGNNWREHKENLAFGVSGGWYLYDEKGQRRKLSRPWKKWSKVNFNLFHYMLFEPGKGIRWLVKGLFGLSKGMRQGKGAWTKLFHAFFEKPMKTLLFNCEECGDCFLQENFSLCTIGRCEKGLANAPCGDANPDGTCGNNEDIRCVGELIYNSAASEGAKGLEKLAGRINCKRNPQLQGTSSILNNFFGRDHCHKVELVQIGDKIHGHIPTVGGALAELLEKGLENADVNKGAGAYLVSLISSQAKHGANYIAVNIDKFADSDMEQGVALIGFMAGLTAKYGMGVPVYIDSVHEAVIEAGLKAWFAADKVKDAPLVKIASAEMLGQLASWRALGEFGAAFGWAKNAADLRSEAEEVLAATQSQDMSQAKVFLEVPVTPLMEDTVGENGQASKTHDTFEAVRRLKHDRRTKGMHLMVGVVDSAMKAPGRSIGIGRAYVAKAQEYGVDSIKADTTLDYGLTAPAEDLVALVDALAKQDGGPAAKQRATELVTAFCNANQKAKR